MVPTGIISFFISDPYYSGTSIFLHLSRFFSYWGCRGNIDVTLIVK